MAREKKPGSISDAFAPKGPRPDGDGNPGLAGGTDKSIDPKNASSGFGSVDADGPPKRGRGRPPGGGKSAPRQERRETLSLEGLEALLFSVHLQAATLLSTPELALEQGEANALAQATKAVSKHYDLPGFSEKAFDTVNFCIVAATIYGARWVALRMRWKAEADAKKAKPASPPVEKTVFEFKPVPDVANSMSG